MSEASKGDAEELPWLAGNSGVSKGDMEDVNSEALNGDGEALLLTFWEVAAGLSVDVVTLALFVLLFLLLLGLAGLYL